MRYEIKKKEEEKITFSTTAREMCILVSLSMGMGWDTLCRCRCRWARTKVGKVREVGRDRG